MLNLVKGCKIFAPDKLNEGYEVSSDILIKANVNAEKILDVFWHFITIHDEPLFFILELPVTSDREAQISPGIDKKCHKDIYYIDGCSRKECLMLMDKYGELFINDSISKFGFGRYKS